MMKTPPLVRRSMEQRTLLVCGIALVIVIVASCLVQAQERSAASTPERVQSAAPSQRQFRRIFVPADRIDVWPREGRKYLPIDAQEFESLLKTANDGQPGDNASATIDSAEYAGSLNAEGVLGGRATWKITQRGSGSAFIQLPAGSPIVRNAHWKDKPSELVRMGLWSDEGEGAAAFGLEVPSSGTLEFEWSARPQVQNSGFEMPWNIPATSTRLTLDLADRQVPRLDSAATLQSDLVQEPARESRPMRRWVMVHGPSTDAVLRISNLDENSPKTVEQPAVRCDTDYQVARRGLEISTDWRIEGPFTEQREFSFTVPVGVQITSLTVNGQEVNWRVSPGITPEFTTVTVQHPVGSSRTPIAFRLAAWQPLKLDLPWQLPVVRPLNVFWSSGRIRFGISPEFELKRINPSDCAQTEVVQLGTKSPASEAFSYAAFSPAATLEILLGLRDPDVSVRMGSSLALSDPDITGKLVSEWNVSRSSVHRMSGQLAAGWNVEAVETVPADALAEWFIDRRNGRRNLEIRLTDAVAPNRNISVVVSGRLPRFNLSEPASADVLRMVRWAGARVTRHLFTFQMTEPYVLETFGKASFLPSDTVRPNELALIDAAADRNRIVDLTTVDSNDGVRLAVKRAQYAADIRGEIECLGEAVHNIWKIAILPKTGTIERLYVYASAPLGETARWTDRSTNVPIQAERAAIDASSKKNLPNGGELWLLRLPRPSAQVAKLELTFDRPLKRKLSIGLLSVPDAMEQSGLAVVRASHGQLPEIDAEGFVPIPRAEPATGADSTTPASVEMCYQFSPRSCWDASRAPRLRIDSRKHDIASAIAIENFQVDSFFGADGRAVHRAVFQLRNFGASNFTVALPPRATIAAAYLNGRNLSVSANPSGTPLDIPLLPGQVPVTITLFFESHDMRLWALRTLVPPIATNEYPILSGQWTAWLPEDYSVANRVANASRSLNWRQRIFGFLAAENNPRFNPLRSADWASLFDSEENGPVFKTELPKLVPSAAAASQVIAPIVTMPLPGMTATSLLPLAAAAGSNTLEQAPTLNIPQLVGWKPVQQRFVAEGAPAAIVAYRPATINSWAVACLLASFLLGRWLSRDLRNLILSISLAAGLALVLPVPFAPLATGALWGLMGAIALRWRRLSKLPMIEHGTSLSRNSAIALLICLGAGLVAGNARGQAAEPAAQSSGPRPMSPIERVFIPIDDSKKPVGTKVFVSDEFLRDLFAPSARSTQTAKKWTIFDATYNGELIENRGQAGISAGTWSLALNIETFFRHTKVRLPLVRNEANWQSTAMLEGVPSLIQWAEDGRSCVLDVAEPGHYVLTLFCTPNISPIEGGGELRLSVPQLPLAKISLRTPDRLADVRISDAILARVIKDSPGLRTGELWQANQIHVAWSTAEPKSTASQGLNISELNWLHVEPHGIELEAKFIVEGGARRPESLAIQYDDRWELISNNGATNNSRGADGKNGLRTLQLPLPNDDIDRQEIITRWKRVNAPEIGNLHVRPISLITNATTQRWFSVSADTSIDCTAVESKASTATAKEFQSKWGDNATSDVPGFVLTNVDPVQPITLSLRPHEAESAIRETLHLAIGRQMMRALYQADVSPGTDHCFQYKLAAPQEFVIDDVALAEADRQIGVRWSHDENHQVTVFFGETASSDYRLTVSGTIPLKLENSISLPRIAAIAAPNSSHQVQLYRDDEVVARVENVPKTDDGRTVPIAPSPIQWLVRPLTSLPLSDAAARNVRIIAKPNDAVVRGDMLTTVFREGGRWWGTLHARVFAEHDDLDVVKIELPAACSGPFDISASTPVTTEVTGKAERQILTARLSSTVPIGQSLDLQLRTPLVAAAGSAPFVPNIEIAKFVGHRYLSVPTKLDSQPVEWSDVGVQQTSAPDALLQSQTRSADVGFLEVVKNPFEVAIRTQTMRQPVPVIRLAESSVSLGKHGGQVVESRFVIAPDGITKCVLKIPSGQRFLTAELDGQPALVSLNEQNERQVLLGSPVLPQIISVRTWLDESGGSRTANPLQRPSIQVGGVHVPVELSLWEVAEVPDAEPCVIEGAASVAAADLATLRFDRLVRIAETATSALADLPAENRLGWFQSWRVILHEAHRAATKVKSTEFTPRVQQLPRTADEQVDLAVQRFDRWVRSIEELVNTTSSTSLVAPPMQPRVETFAPVEQEGSQEAAHLSCYVFDGDADQMTLRPEKSWNADVIAQFGGILSVMALTLAAIWIVRLPTAKDIVIRWPQALGALAGLFYWAFLWPSWLGLILVALSVWVGLRSMWPGHTIRPEPSTVLRSTRTLQP